MLDVVDLLPALPAHFRFDRMPAHARNRRLACRVNIREDEEIRRGERLAEFVGEKLRARVAVRLECADETLGLRLLCRLERRCDFRRVMRVAIDDPDAAYTPLRLKAALRAVEYGKPCRELFKRDADRKSRDDARERIEHVMASGDVERDVAEPLLSMHDVKRDARAVRHDMRRTVVCLVINRVGDVLAINPLCDMAQVRVVGTENRPPRPLIDVFDELHKRLDDIFHRAVVVHMIVFDIRDNGDMRAKL